MPRASKNNRATPPTKSVSLAWRDRLKAWFWRKQPVLRLGALFTALMAVYCCFIVAPVSDRVLGGYLDANARLASFLLNALGEQSRVAGSVIASDEFSIIVVKSCSGLEYVWFLCAAVLVLPLPFARKIPGLMAALILLPALNVVRISSLYFVGVHKADYFDWVHEKLWAVLLMLGMAVVFVGWLGWAVGHQNPLRRLLTVFLVRLTLVYVGLIIPWTGLAQGYSTLFRAVAEPLFTCRNAQSEVYFEPPPPNGLMQCDTRIVIVNTALMNADGSGPVRNLDFNVETFGWSPVALFVALVMVTPLPWKRRRWGLLVGCLGMNGLVFVALAFCLWTESMEISLVHLTALGKVLALGLKDALTTQLAFAIPVLTWVLCIFRREDKLGNVAVFATAADSRNGQVADRQ
jgi:exosortase/archaeosortase family protein